MTKQKKNKSLEIMCDTREGLPLDGFSLPVKEMGMNIGDYGMIIDNSVIPPLVFERKSIGDLFGTMTKGYKRFEKECERAQQKGIQIILVIEVPYSVVKSGYKFSTTDGSKILKTLETLYLKYQIPTWFCDNRYNASKRIENMCLAVERRYRKKGKLCFWETKNLTEEVL